jgi:(p)ppGpp synthase/HD superfamily hydrolase
MRPNPGMMTSNTTLTGETTRMLTDRFTRAVDYARIAHAAQVRKGSNIPYLYHLLGVASLVIEFGGSEDQAIAGLLHDTLEDCGAEHEPIIRAQFGDAVADIVLACTDGTAEDKSSLIDAESKRRDWLARKLAYLAHLAEAPDAVLLVSGCDKLHNARAIVQDMEDPNVGVQVFERFKGGQAGTLAYYESLSRIFLARQITTAVVLDAVVARMHVLAGSCERTALTV